MITLETELARINGLGERFLKNLAKLGLVTVRDLLWHFPYRYDDFSSVIPIAQLEAGTTATVSGIIQSISARQTWRRHMVLVEAVIEDESGNIRAVWFNQPYLAKVLRQGMRVRCAGKVASDDGEKRPSRR